MKKLINIILIALVVIMFFMFGTVLLCVGKDKSEDLRVDPDMLYINLENNFNYREALTEYPRGKEIYIEGKVHKLHGITITILYTYFEDVQRIVCGNPIVVQNNRVFALKDDEVILKLKYINNTTIDGVVMPYFNLLEIIIIY